MESFFIPFISIALAELFDKSQIAVHLLASQTKRQKELFLGVFLAFVVLTALATGLGGLLGEFLPASLLKIVSGVAFIIFGIQMFFSKQEGSDEVKKKSSVFLSGFLLILVSELGDKTQLSTIVFATRYSPFLVFLGSLGALSLLAVVAIKVGGFFRLSSKKALITKIAGLVFIALGLLFLLF